MADEVQTPLNDGELEIMQPIDASEPARVPALGDGGEFQPFKEPSVYVPYVQYDSIESLSVYGSVEGVSSIYVNSHQYVLPIPKPLTAGDVWHSKVKSSYDKRIVLDGAENWRLITASDTNYFLFDQGLPNGRFVANEPTVICDRYKSTSYANRTSPCVYAYDYGGTSLGFADNSYDSVDNWKSYLAAQKAAGTPVVVYYQSTAYDGTNGLTVSIADYQDEIYANNFVDVFTDDGELWVDGGDFVEVAVNNIVLNGKTNDERAGEYGTPQVHTFP